MKNVTSLTQQSICAHGKSCFKAPLSTFVPLLRFSGIKKLKQSAQGVTSGWGMPTGRLSDLLNCKLHKEPLDICPTQKPQ